MPEPPEIVKERPLAPHETTYVVETGKFNETQAEKEGLIKRVEDFELEKQVTDRGQVLVTSAAAQKPKIILPIKKTSYLNPVNWKKPVEDAIRWLLVWAKRILKMYPDRSALEEA